MYCEKCSAENPNDANFCFICAYPITAIFQTVSTARQVVPLGAAFDDEIMTEIRPVLNLYEKDDLAQKRENRAANIFALIVIYLVALVTGISYLIKIYN